MKQVRKVKRSTAATVSAPRMREALAKAREHVSDSLHAARVSAGGIFKHEVPEGEAEARLSAILGVHPVTLRHWALLGAKPMNWLALQAVADGKTWVR